jgi:hypothetical protein
VTADDIGRLTIAEVEAIAERAGKALAAFREAREALGAASAPRTEPVAPAPVPGPRVALTPAEMGERERLMRQFRNEDLPPYIQAAEENQ